MTAPRWFGIAALAIGLVLIVSAAGVPAGDGKIRVFVADSQSWEVSGGEAAHSSAAAAAASGGARPQTAEIMKTFGDRCPAVTVTMKKDNADFVVLLDHEGGKQLIQRDNKVAVFSKDGDMIYSGSTRTLGNAVKNVCAAVTGRSSTP
jgi:hypothetical protein